MDNLADNLATPELVTKIEKKIDKIVKSMENVKVVEDVKVVKVVEDVEDVKVVKDVNPGVLMAEMEVEGAKAAKKILEDNDHDIGGKPFGNAIKGFLDDAHVKFREKTGRNMTYGEMRMMYG